MEALGLLKTLVKSVDMARKMAQEHILLRQDLDNGLEWIIAELSMLKSEVENAIKENDVSQKPPQWILELQDLAFDIEDFVVERSRDPKISAPAQMLRTATLADPIQGYVAKINHFRARVRQVQERRNNPQIAPATTATRGIPAPVARPLQADRPVGFEEQIDDLVGLLSEANGDGHQQQLKVISIVGCGGLGKTTLARELYDDPRVRKLFPQQRAIVEAPSSVGNVNSSFLETIRQQLGYRVTWEIIFRLLPFVRSQGSNDPARDYEQKKQAIWTFLGTKRYFIVIDGLEHREVWEAIRAVLPNNSLGSRVVVTTSTRSVARSCSSGCYVYHMRGLDNRSSAHHLFWKRLHYDEDRPPALEEALKNFFGKCDGLPLALVGAAEYLDVCRARGTDLDNPCRDLGDALGSFLTGDEPGFQELKKTLARCCDRVRKEGQKKCLLSLSSFPEGHLLNGKSMIQRWIAEGILDKGDQREDINVANDCLRMLMDLGIVEPVPRGNSIGAPKVKKCQVHGVMREFLVRRAALWNFIKVIDEGRVVDNHESSCHPRRLCINGDDHGIISAKNKEWMETLDRIRSLTICSRRNLRICLTHCKLLRLLDLEACSWLEINDLDHICKLLYLKYLSLRSTPISAIPKTIRNLECLETLDVRQTQVDKLPLEVIKLPMITHLFGKFELPTELGETKRAEELKQFFFEKSKLKTLSGFKIVNNNQGFLLILVHASMLKKVKIWCDVPTALPSPSPSRSKWRSLRKSISGAFNNKKGNRISNVDNLPDSLLCAVQQRLTGTSALESLSVDFGGLCKNFLDSVMKDPCAVNTIKVRGHMETLPISPTLAKVRCIRELHLCYTGLRSEDLSGLQTLPCLVHLKLAENREDCWNVSFIVKADGFRSLSQLCFQGPKIPLLEFQENARTPLVSLQLICPDPGDQQLGVKGIMHLKFLNEVILHPNSCARKLEAWKREALMHKNRPYVKIQQV